ncbi:MAG: L-sorbosone dehydrogenase [uncultured Truepera sp.]|uniref:L-sorbosone dehydrogenase n=1 Tax=uncultured Truepera sp. TaxID=543023 RepID=A0A6J4V3R6_9DEIN|nr:MAG: L-sorbosone dehydrogenase [uncultured Truepera sp.]
MSLGSSCNVCREKDKRLAAVSVYDADGLHGQPFMTGLRNAVGLALNPVSGEVWATNNGRDLLGNDQPPETVYMLRRGENAGWPRCHAGTVIDPDFGSERACQGVADPAITDTAHSAPLGAVFYTGDAFPEAYRGDLFIAYHGSWNRVPPTGYKVVRVPIEDGEVAGEPTDFAMGWLEQDGSSTGRPVGTVVAQDGALLVSDDKTGIIYRVSYDADRADAGR